MMAFLTRQEKITTIGTVFGVPLVVKGWSGLPFTPLAAWGLLAWLAGRRDPQRTLAERLSVGGLMTVATLGSEWCHNLSHAAAAQLSGQPMDALRVMFGMPLVIYYEPNDPTVTPRQHILRALGGPLFNTAGLLVSLLARARTAPGSAGREIAGAAAWMNGFIVVAGLTPCPGFDGGPILKWSLVEAGRTPAEARQIVKRANGVAAAGYAAASAAAFTKWKGLLAGLLALLGGLALAVAVGWLKDPD